MAEPNFMKLGMYITVPEPISTAYFINPNPPPVCVYMCIPLQLLDNSSVKIPLSLLGNSTVKNVTAVRNSHATIKEMFGVLVSL
jgi:hypothetical protein